MRVRSLRWLVLFGCAAIVFGAIGVSVSSAQAVENVPDAEVHSSAAESKPPEWDGSGPHPGQADFDQYCRLCHQLSTVTTIGPGLVGLAQRIEQGDPYEGKSPVQRLSEFIRNVNPGDPDATRDPYFKKVQAEVAGPGIQMTLRGGLPEDISERRLLNIIDYILRFRDVSFDEKQYWREVEQGRALVGGEAPFQWGGPSCAGCHTVGPDRSMMGANVGPNIAHTYVLMRQLGSDEKNNYVDGLKAILSGENAPQAHHFYKDVEGSSPLNDAELKVVATYFEQAARDTGTEHDSNYLPIFALLFAALGILLLEPGIVNILFAKEHGEYVDGPYKEDDHHGHDDHEAHAHEGKQEEVKAEVKSEDASTAGEEKSEAPVEDKPAEEKVEEKPDEKSGEASDAGENKKEDS